MPDGGKDARKTARYSERPASPGTGLGLLWWQAMPPNAVAYEHRVVPDGCVDLIWSAEAGEVHVAGPDTGPYLAGLAPGSALVGVRFRPGSARPALGLSVAAVRDARVPLPALWGPAADSLADSVAGAVAGARLSGGAGSGGGSEDGPLAAGARVLAAAVTARIRGAEPADRADAAAAEIAAALAGGTVGAAADRLGWSERQLRRRCAAAFGYGPKTVQRVLRFQRALRLVRAGRRPAEVAYACGYADQAHLAHEVRDLAGVPLGDLL